VHDVLMGDWDPPFQKKGSFILTYKSGNSTKRRNRWGGKGGAAAKALCKFTGAETGNKVFITVAHAKA